MTKRETELKNIETWLAEAKEALQRQQRGPFDRGDGQVIIAALGEFLKLSSPEDVLNLHRRRDWLETHP
jgi:hypothetical protein